VKFRDYVHLRSSGRGAHHRGIAILRAYDLPDVFVSWPALRDWLRANGAPPSDIGVSRPVWMAYRRCLEFNGIFQCRRRRQSRLCAFPAPRRR
jgi:hypothetical protein